MYWLVLYMVGSGSAMLVMPEKYPTEQACKEAASPWQMARQATQPTTYQCIKTALAVEIGKPCADPSGTCPLSNGTIFYCAGTNNCKIEAPKYDNCTYTDTLKICSK